MQEVKLTQSFATHGHTSSVRCVTSSGKYLASGGADDRIIVYDMKTRKEHCMLNTHNSTVTCLKFTNNNSHLISGSNDGILAIVRVGNWQLEKQWEKPHKGAAILDIAIHPTGKLSLTLGADQTLRTWNLIKGRLAYAINLTTKSSDSKSLNCVKWSPCGENFILSGGLHLEFWNISIGGIVNKFQFESKVATTSWLKETHLAIGHENGHITILDIKKHKQQDYIGHSTRVKCLDSSDKWLISASSDGHVKIWKFEANKLIEIGNTNTGCRCTSLALVFNDALKAEKELSTEDSVEKSDSESIEEITNEEKRKLIGNEKNTQKFKQCKVTIEEENTDKVKNIKRNKKRKLSK